LVRETSTAYVLGQKHRHIFGTKIRFSQYMNAYLQSSSVGINTIYRCILCHKIIPSFQLLPHLINAPRLKKRLTAHAQSV